MSDQPVSKTATDTLAKKSKSEDVISGGHLAAKALKNEDQKRFTSKRCVEIVVAILWQFYSR